jgi:6-phosphofructokinase 1
MKIGILTGGGDTPSLNAILYGAAQQAQDSKHRLLGVMKGWEGILNPLYFTELKPDEVDANEGGTKLRSSRTNPEDETLDKAVDNIHREFDALIAIGGDDTLTVGKKLLSRLNIPICFVTKTIDNDVGQNSPEGKIDYSAIINYFTSGFATAALKAAQYAAELRTTAYSHERVIFLETMGRTPGWLALSSYAGNPDFILVPEFPLNFANFKEQLAKLYRDKRNVVVAVAEGVRYEGTDIPIAQDESNIDTFGHKKLGGVAEALASRIKDELNINNCNHVNPNYLYRSGPPSQTDMDAAIKLGIEAVKAIHKDRTGYVMVLQMKNSSINAIPMKVDEVLLTDASGHIVPRNLDERFYDPTRYAITDAGIKYFEVMR